MIYPTETPAYRNRGIANALFNAWKACRRAAKQGDKSIVRQKVTYFKFIRTCNPVAWQLFVSRAKLVRQLELARKREGVEDQPIDWQPDSYDVGDYSREMWS